VFAISTLLGTKEKFYDLTGGSTFVLVALLSYISNSGFHLRQKVITGCVVTWGLRLSLYLFQRILKEGRDRRFNRVRDKPSQLFIFWTIQGVWVLLTLLPVLILNSKKDDIPVDNLDRIGWGLWSAGFLIESIADLQKARFQRTKGKEWIDTGLWSLSRHPNYLGEIMMWCGIFLSSSRVMRGLEYLSVLSPAFVSFLLCCVSGIPLLEQSADKRWGSSIEYQLYKKHTAILIPFLW